MEERIDRERKGVEVLVSGRVQGVCFRMETERMARSLGLDGWVRNLPDGRVQAVFEGDAKAVDQAVEWCRKGPPMARVDRLEKRELPVSGEFGGFTIRY